MTINRTSDCNNNSLEMSIEQQPPAAAAETITTTSMPPQPSHDDRKSKSVAGEVIKVPVSRQQHSTSAKSSPASSPVKPARPSQQQSKAATLPPVENCEPLGVVAGARRVTSAAHPPPNTVVHRKTMQAPAAPKVTGGGVPLDWKAKLNSELLAYQQQLNRQLNRNPKFRKQQPLSPSCAPANSVAAHSSAPATSNSSRPESAKSRSSQTSSEKAPKAVIMNGCVVNIPVIDKTGSEEVVAKKVEAKKPPDSKIAAPNLDALNSISHNKLATNVIIELEQSVSPRSKLPGGSQSAHGPRKTATSMAAAVRPRAKIETPYARVMYALDHDKTWLKEVSFGRRIGFYRFRGDIGYGNFSQVKVAAHILTKEKVAVKILNKSRLDPKTQTMLKREIKTMESLHHPNLIQIFEVIETVPKHYIVMELAGGGELFNVITEQGRFPEKEAKFFFAQIVSAIDHMHQHNLIHRDIKAENVFFADAHTIKVGDFGFSTRLASSDQLLSTYCGSPPYAAPELFRDESYAGPPVDYWALGALLYFIVTATMPFKASTIYALKRLILECRYDIPNYVSVECCQLIASLLQLDPAKRYNLEQVKATRWLRNQLPAPAYTKYELKGSLTRYQRYRRAMLARCEAEESATYRQMLANNPRRPMSMEGIESTMETNSDTLVEATSRAKWISHHNNKETTQLERIEVKACAGAGNRTALPVIAEEEKETFAKLAALGIDEDILQRHLEKGSGSHIVGMFRILLHRERNTTPLRAKGVQRAQSIAVKTPQQSPQKLTPNGTAHDISTRRNSRPFERFWTSKKGLVDEATLKQLANGNDKGGSNAVTVVNKEKPASVRHQATELTSDPAQESSKRFSLKRIFSMNDRSSPEANVAQQPKVIHHHIVEMKTAPEATTPQRVVIETRKTKAPTVESRSTAKKAENGQNSSRTPTKRGSIQGSNSSASSTSRPPTAGSNKSDNSRTSGTKRMATKDVSPLAPNSTSATFTNVVKIVPDTPTITAAAAASSPRKASIKEEGVVVLTSGDIQRTDQSAGTLNPTSASTKKSISKTTTRGGALKTTEKPAPVVHDTKVVAVIPNGYNCSPLSSMLRGLNGSRLRRTQTTPNVAACYREEMNLERIATAAAPPPAKHPRRTLRGVGEYPLASKHSQSANTIKQRGHCIIV